MDLPSKGNEPNSLCLDIRFHNKKTSDLPITDILQWNLNAAIRFNNATRPQEILTIVLKRVVGGVDIEVTSHALVPKLLIGLLVQASAIY